MRLSRILVAATLAVMIGATLPTAAADGTVSLGGGGGILVDFIRIHECSPCQFKQSHPQFLISEK